MGYFGTFQFDGSAWSEQDPDVGPVGVGPWLRVDIHDSSLTTVRYSPHGDGTGVAFLGFTPRVYFGDPEASHPADIEADSLGLMEWWAARNPDATPDDRAAKAAEIAAFLATDEEPAEEQDDDDIFVEVKTVRFLSAMDLAIPAGLPTESA